MVTIKDVAKKAGVAISTASYALNGSKKISEKTRLLVLEAAKSLNYTKNGYASDLKKRSTGIIALTLNDLSGPYYSELIKGVQDTALEHGYDLIACSTTVREKNARESTGIKFLRERRVDGAIVFTQAIPDEVLIETAKSGIPLILLDRSINCDQLVNVTVDNRNGGYKATEHLIQLGHRHIGFVSGPTETLDSQDRFAGFREALHAHHLDFQTKWHFPGQFTQDSGYRATKILLAQPDWPTAVVYANDEMAIGALKAFKERHVHVPEDISIVGFDDIELAGLVAPGLTTMRQPKYEIGSLCTRYLFHRLNNEKVEPRTTLSTELIVRESTSRPSR